MPEGDSARCPWHCKRSRRGDKWPYGGSFPAAERGRRTTALASSPGRTFGRPPGRAGAPVATTRPSRRSSIAITGRSCRSAATCSPRSRKPRMPSSRPSYRPTTASASATARSHSAVLFTIARNACLSTLRARREQTAELEDVPTAGFERRQQRSDLRDLLADIRDCRTTSGGARALRARRTSPTRHRPCCGL